jgi:predicted PurR-regulated permease PerM
VSHSDTRRWQVIALRLLVLVAFAWMARQYLAPILLGGVLAVVLQPAHQRLRARIRGRPSAFVITIVVLLVALVPLAFLLLRAAIALNDFLAYEWTATAARVQDYFSGDDGVLSTFGVAGNSLAEAADAAVQNIAGGLARLAGGFVAAVPEQVIAVFLLSASLYYLLEDGPRLIAWLVRASPFGAAETGELVVSIRATIRGVVIGLFGTALIQGTLTTVALLLCGVPAPFALGVIAGFLSVTPIVGTTPVTVGAAVYLAATGQVGAAVGMGVAAIVIGLSDNLVRPFFMHHATPHQHPIMILLGIFGGVSVFGASGVFLGPILAALAAWVAVQATRSRSEGPVPDAR